MKKIAIILLVLLSGFQLQAQVVNVCGTDSIFLQVDNYDNKGVIEWQESIDSINWVTIPEIVGETYKFFPSQSKYYRAVVKTSTCDPLYSAFSFVQLPPIANAGSDKLVGGKSTILLGNQLLGVTGEWSIIKGDSGVLEESKKAYSGFSGKYNIPYKLVWTVTNGCGQSTDTINIQFEEIIVKNNFVVVDNTDSLYSDSTEMVNGMYRIKFSDPTIVLSDSVVLIGMRQDRSFLRKVISFTLQDSIYTLNTEQGAFEDLFKGGTIDIGNAINQGILDGSTTPQRSRIKGVNPYPTRQTLKNYTKTDETVMIYSGESFSGYRMKVENSDNIEGDKDIYIPISPKSIVEINIGNANLKVTLEDFLFKITPNFQLKYSPFPQFKFSYGLDNANIRLAYTTKFELTGALNFVKEDIKLLPTYKEYFVPIIFGVPVPIVLNIDLKAICKVGAEMGITITNKNNYTGYLNAAINASIWNPIPNFTFSTKEESTSSTNIAGSYNGGIHIELIAGPEISFMIFDVVGPYLNTPVKMETDLKWNSNQNWSGKKSIGLFGYIGAKIEVEGLFRTNEIFNKKWSMWGDNINYITKWPYKIILQSGEDQNGQAAKVLSKPIAIKVISQEGNGVPSVPVRFSLESGNGTVQSSVLMTDMLGQVHANWTLGSNPECKLKAYVLDYENIDIEGSPIYVTAYSSGRATNCENSNLAITMKETSTYKYPVATGGTAPYTYSINGIDYSTIIPQFSLSTRGNFTVYLRDKNQCTKVKTVTISSPNVCDNTELTMDVVTTSNSVTLTGKKGTAPYLYAIDNQTNYSENNFFSNLTTGYHLIFVKDAKGCIVSRDVKIDTNISAAIRSLYPAQGAISIPLSPNSFKWVAANYATNQVYDLFLKKGTDAYSLIASNLSTAAYTYSTSLLPNTTYTWKVAVKTGTIVIDNSEFTFTTSSGVATVPIAPLLFQPNNGFVTEGVTATFKWSTQIGDFKYDLYLDSNDASTLVALNLNNTECTINNLISGKTYYWKVKIKSSITGISAFSAIRSFSVKQNNNTVMDIDGNVYHILNIGAQTWMVENLKTTKYNDGTSIPLITDGETWSNLNTPAYCWYNNDATINKDYGALYNWYTVKMDKLAPIGWHVPSDDEWTTLEKNVNTNLGISGSLAKALASTTNWALSSTARTIGNNLTKNNSSGFSALPGGSRKPGYKSSIFDYVGKIGFWWSTTESNTSSLNALNMFMSYNDSAKNGILMQRQYGYSIRCIKDPLPIVLTNTPLSISTYAFTIGGNVTDIGRSAITERGFCWSTSSNPTITNNRNTIGTGNGTFTSSISGLVANTIYYVRAYATNNTGTGYGNEVSFSTLSAKPVIDIDGNEYHMVTIGTQTWMVENLKTTRYRNGEIIGTTTPPTKNISSENMPKYQWAYNGDVNMAFKYGRLYTWYAVADSRNIAPTGWHIPSDEEWSTLENYLIANGFNYDGTNTGNKIAKSLAASTDWNSYTGTGTIGNDFTKNNSSGFTALPGGDRLDYGMFYLIVNNSIWWSSTETTSTYAWYRTLSYNSNYLFRSNSAKSYGLSVRCVKD